MGENDGRASAPYDQERAERAVRELLIALGEDPNREGLQETPARVARALKENFEGLWKSPEDVLTTTFDIGHEELVIIRDIEVFSHTINDKNFLTTKVPVWIEKCLRRPFH